MSPPGPKTVRTSGLDGRPKPKRMKARLNISLTLAAACLCGLSSCVSIVSGDGTGDTAISFATPSADTKAAVEDNLSDNSEFLVWGGYRDDANSVDATNVFNGETVTGSGNVWNYTGGTRYWVAGKTYDFYAVYPADIFSGQSSTSTDTPSVTCSPEGIVTIENFDASATGEAAVDLMTASATGVVANDIITNGGAVGLSFKHELARVNFTVVSEGDALTISGAKLYGISHTGTLSGVQWTSLIASAVDNPSFKTETLDIADTQDHLLFGGDLLLPPQTLSDGAILAFSYQYEGDTDSHSVTLYVKTTNVAEWTAGQRYNYRISIPQNPVDISLDVTVKDWDVEDLTVEW